MGGHSVANKLQVAVVYCPTATCLTMACETLGSNLNMASCG